MQKTYITAAVGSVACSALKWENLDYLKPSVGDRRLMPKLKGQKTDAKKVAKTNDKDRQRRQNRDDKDNEKTR